MMQSTARLVFGICVLGVLLAGCPGQPGLPTPPAPQPSGTFEPGDGLEHAPGVTGEARRVTLKDPDGNPLALVYEIIDGLAITQGDIILGTAEELAELERADHIDLNPQGLTVHPVICARFPLNDVCQSNLWNFFPFAMATVYYTIERDWIHPETELDSNAEMIERIRNAISAIEAVSWVRFVEIKPGDFHSYVTFRRSPTGGCSAWLGRKGGQQFINLTGRKDSDNAGCTTGSVIHEILHALGIMHEHARHDRDDFVRILWDNIDGGRNVRMNFEQSDLYRDFGPYDYDSIMHYSAFAFCRRNANDECIARTIETIPPWIPIGRRGALSPGDIATINMLYPGEPPKITISQPADGARFYLGEEVWIEAVATEHLGEFLPLRWTLPGEEVETQPNPAGSNVLITSSLPTGAHTITATATDRTGAQSTAELRVTIAYDAPEVFIFTPKLSSLVWANQPLTLSGTALSKRTPLPDEQMSWRVISGSSTVHSDFGHTTTVPANKLPAGSYRIEFSATDDVKRVTRTITVNLQPKPAHFPTATIVSPTQGSRHAARLGDASASISFSGTATDPEDGVLSGTYFRWRAEHLGGEVVLCEGNDFLGQIAPVKDCSSFTATLLLHQLGTDEVTFETNYTLYLEVKDTEGNLDEAAIAITVFLPPVP